MTMELSGRNLLFVYGTLKLGGSNHPRLADQLLVGPARTVPGFTLYSLGEYPGLVSASDDDFGVNGELWAVDDASLARLDAFEGVDEGLYARVPAPLHSWPPTVSDANARRAWMYLYLRDVHGLPRIGANWPV
jgi:gamma-glutamylaminecyclotransferase